MSVLSQRIGIDTSQSEVSQLDVKSISFNQDVLRFEVSVYNAVSVTILE